MKSKTTLHRVLAAFAVAACSLLAGAVAAGVAKARAAETYDAAALAKRIAPFIEPETVGIVRVDVARIDIDAIADTLVRLFPEGTDDFARAKAEVSSLAEKFRKGGGKDLYYVITPTPNWNRPVVVVVPLAPDVDEKTLVAELPPMELMPAQRIGNALVLAFDEQTAGRLKSMKPDVRPELVAAFEATGDSAIQVLVLPPKHFAKVFDETMPELPKEIGGGPGTILTKGVKWAALGVNLPPKTAARLIVQSQDAQAAEGLLKKLNEVVKFVGQQDTTKKLVPKFDRLVATLVPKVEGNRVVLAIDETGAKNIIALLQPAVEQARNAARRSQSSNNLKQIALAMHIYHDVNKSFPPAAIRDKDGKPLLSWRVLLLPYLEQGSLYKEFHLDEPWDSAHNKPLLAKMPAVYRVPMSKLRQQDRTNYVVPIGPGSVFANPKGASMRDITDGTSNTIMALEVDDTHAVAWTKPEDLAYDPKEPLKGLGNLYDGGFNAALCDGAVRFIPKTIDLKTLRLLITAADGKPIPSF